MKLVACLLLASAAADLTYIQIQCPDSNCADWNRCDGGPIAQSTCVDSTGGGSAELLCLSTTHMQTKLWNNAHCSGPAANVSNITLNVCTKSSIGRYFEDLCCEDNDARKICTGHALYSFGPT